MCSVFRILEAPRLEVFAACTALEKTYMYEELWPRFEQTIPPLCVSRLCNGLSAQPGMEQFIYILGDQTSRLRKKWQEAQGLIKTKTLQLVGVINQFH